MTAKYKFYYFPIRGRGEFIRYIFAYSKVPYEEILITGAEWPSKRAETPMGVLPVLELENGVKLSQSLAIGRYLAAKFDLLSNDDFENALGDQIAGAIEDLYRPYFRPHAMAYDAKDEAKLKEAWVEIENHGLGPLFNYLEKMLESRTWFCGQKIHWVDLYVAEVVDRFETAVGAKEFVAKYPKLLAHCRRIHDTPSVRAYVQKRPHTPY